MFDLSCHRPGETWNDSEGPSLLPSHRSFPECRGTTAKEMSVSGVKKWHRSWHLLSDAKHLHLLDVSKLQRHFACSGVDRRRHRFECCSCPALLRNGPLPATQPHDSQWYIGRCPFLSFLEMSGHLTLNIHCHSSQQDGKGAGLGRVLSFLNHGMMTLIFLYIVNAPKSHRRHTFSCQGRHETTPMTFCSTCTGTWIPSNRQYRPTYCAHCRQAQCAERDATPKNSPHVGVCSGTQPVRPHT